MRFLDFYASSFSQAIDVGKSMLLVHKTLLKTGSALLQMLLIFKKEAFLFSYLGAHISYKNIIWGFNC